MDSVAENITGNESPLAGIYGDPTEYQFRFLFLPFDIVYLDVIPSH
jgi:hypothetical protein